MNVKYIIIIIIENIASYNINGGANNKLGNGSLLHKHVIKFNIDICIIIETWWNSNNNKSIKFNKKWLPAGFELSKLYDAIKLSNNP